MKRSLRASLLPVALLLGAPTTAFAGLSCDDIMNMVNVNVPTSLVVQTMQGSGEVFNESDIRCLIQAGAPQAVVDQAKTMTAAAAAPAPAPTTSKEENIPSPKRSSLDEGEDILNNRTSSRKPRDLQDLPEKGETSEAPDPEQIRSAIEDLKTKRPTSAAVKLYEALESGSFPDQETKINYYLGRALFDLKIYHGAQYHYLQVLRKGPDNQYFAYALPKLVQIANLTGDNSDLLRVVPKLSPEAYPRGSEDTLYYLMGLRLFEEDDLSTSRKYFEQVSQKSELYLRSKYMEGVIANKQGKLKSAVRDFRDVYREQVAVYNDPTELEAVENIKDLALINVARIYYGIERFDEASKYYGLVNHDSRYWPQALFENGWARFMQNDLNSALGQLLTVQSPFFRNDEFLPETIVLRALTFFNLCQYGEVEKLLLGFEDDYRPIQNEMRDFVKGYSTEDGRAVADQAWDAYFGRGSKRDSLIPKSVFNRILLNQDLAGLVKHMEQMDRDEGIMDEQKSRRFEPLANYLKDIYEKDRQRYKRRAGLLFLSEMARQANYINDLLTQSEIIRFEVVDAQRVDYSYKMQNPESLNTYQSLQIPFATSTDIIYWPFNGEFWKDELGYYVYTEQATCN